MFLQKQCILISRFPQTRIIDLQTISKQFSTFITRGHQHSTKDTQQVKAPFPSLGNDTSEISTHLLAVLIFQAVYNLNNRIADKGE